MQSLTRSTVPLEHRLVLGLQRRVSNPAATATARALSLVGEHAAGWLLLAGAGAVVDADRRPQWVRAGGAVFLAHAASVVIKRVVRRRRPSFEGLAVRVGVPSVHSFPSSHATSTTAAALAMTPLLGPWLWPVAVAMGVSRVLLGVHFPSDVVAGAALGSVVAGGLGQVRR